MRNLVTSRVKPLSCLWYKPGSQSVDFSHHLIQWTARPGVLRQCFSLADIQGWPGALRSRALWTLLNGHGQYTQKCCSFPPLYLDGPLAGTAEKEGSVQSNSLSQWIAKKCFIDPIPKAESTCVEYRWTERIEAETKWPLFRRRHFQMHFPEWKRLNLD